MSQHPTRPAVREEIWDRFVDALDRAGQAGNAADVLTPTALHPDAPSGKRFGDLTRVEVGNLATIAQSFGRRGDAVMAMWQHTQQKLRAQKRVRTLESIAINTGRRESITDAWGDALVCNAQRRTVNAQRGQRTECRLRLRDSLIAAPSNLAF